MPEGIIFKVTALTSGALRMLTSRTLQAFFFTACLLTLKGPPLPTICKKKLISRSLLSLNNWSPSLSGQRTQQASEP